MSTTIRVSNATLRRLKKLEMEKRKEGKVGVTYDDLVNEALDVLEEKE